MFHIKKNYIKYNLNKSNNVINELILDNLKTASEVIVRYKQPSIFYEISTNSTEIFEILEDYYKGVLSELHALKKKSMGFKALQLEFPKYPQQLVDSR